MPPSNGTDPPPVPKTSATGPYRPPPIQAPAETHNGTAEEGTDPPHHYPGNFAQVHHHSDCSKILPDLYLGNRLPAASRACLDSMGVTHVLNCCTARSEFFPTQGVAYMQLDLLDSALDVPRLGCVVAQAVSFISEGISCGGGVYVHCHCGISRSCTVVCAYLIDILGFSFEGALSKVRLHHPRCDPNLSYLVYLQDLASNVASARVGNAAASPEKQPGADCVQEWSVEEESPARISSEELLTGVCASEFDSIMREVVSGEVGSIVREVVSSEAVSRRMAGNNESGSRQGGTLASGRVTCADSCPKKDGNAFACCDVKEILAGENEEELITGESASSVLHNVPTTRVALRKRSRCAALHVSKSDHFGSMVVNDDTPNFGKKKMLHELANDYEEPLSPDSPMRLLLP